MRVLAIDDHTLVATALTGALRARGYDARACEVRDDAKILNVAQQFAPRVVLLDLELGGGRNSLSLIEPLRASGARVLMLTATVSPMRLARCLEAGADGLLFKGLRIDDVVQAIEDAAAGARVDPPQREALLLRLDEHREKQRAERAPFERLTRREQEVLEALVQGKTAQTMAGQTFTSVRTVRGHIQSVLDKLGVSSQLTAVAKAHAAGWRLGPRRE
jgi:DNA-binding NarL/FixJ family response regulator